MNGLTAAGDAERRLAAFAVDLGLSDIPAGVLHEAKRSLVNVFATALAGCREPAVGITLETLSPFLGAPAASLIGRAERADASTAAFVNAMAANIFDFDDTHEATIIHPAAIQATAQVHAAPARTAPVKSKLSC